MFRFLGLVVLLVVATAINDYLNPPPPPGRFVRTCIHRVLNCPYKRCQLIEEKRKLSPLSPGRDYEEVYTYGVYVDVETR